MGHVANKSFPFWSLGEGDKYFFKVFSINPV